MSKRKQPTDNDGDSAEADQDQPAPKKVATQPAIWNSLGDDEILGELLNI
jgi:hypothetical protein